MTCRRSALLAGPALVAIVAALALTEVAAKPAGEALVVAPIATTAKAPAKAAPKHARQPAPKAVTKPAAKAAPKAPAKPVAKAAAKPPVKAAAKPPVKAAAQPGTTTTKVAVPAPPARPAQTTAKPAIPLALATASADANPFPLPDGGRTSALAYAPTATPSTDDVQAVKEALNLARKGKTEAATERKTAIRDSAAQKLVEWAILRADDNAIGFGRYAAFVNANPGWPSAGMLRRRAEAQLWQERRDPATVLNFFASTKPLSCKGKLAMARALLAQGDQAQAQHYVREAWRQDDMSAELEAQVLETFGELLTRTDHKARMDRRLYAEDSEDALRMAQRLGGTDAAIAKARIAVMRKADNAGALLEAVPSEARNDPGYIFNRIQWLRRNDHDQEAVQLMLAAPRAPAAIHDPDEWWVERRLFVRKLLDAGNAQAAYRVARDAAAPTKSNYRVDQQFTAGWVALRFLDDPQTAQQHFVKMDDGISNPIALARTGYWLGRAAEAAGRGGEARTHYESAARFPTAYYGQLARARLGRSDIAVRRPPAPNPGSRNAELVRALELLYAAGERELVIPFVADVADRASDAGALTAMAEICARNTDARAVLLLGKDALARGLPFDQYAFPNIGIPKYAAVGPDIDRSVVYSIARQESGFNQRTISVAKALGLMQVTPPAGRYIAKKYGVTFDEKRLLSDPVYNTQMGAAEIGGLVGDYDGNYIMAFAGYNAGRGRVREWVAKYGDPRDPQVDPVDWVERIPFSETRNYVQRVMENMQVYRARFGTASQLTIEADLRGTRGN